MNSYPYVTDIPYLSPEALIAVLPRDGLLFLDSSRYDPMLGRFSFLAVSPFQIIEPPELIFDSLTEQLKRFTLPRLDNLPPFQGGAAGMLGYELGRHLEKLPPLKQNDLGFPESIVGLYDLVIAWDHTLQKAWIFSSGFPYLEEPKRATHAKNRLDWALASISRVKTLEPVPSFSLSADNIVSTFTQSEYEHAVQQVIEYIRAGDIFEANISQRFSAILPDEIEPFDLYRKLRRLNPAPFSAYLQFKDYTIASASPERFLKLENRLVETRPIKGTSRRDEDPILDKRNAQRLEQSEKDRAENIMIVDLMRNDLSRVCLPHSVKVPQLCKLESFATVHHLVSVVQGELMPQKTAVDLIRATFPGGSITGAPKIRAMEIISEIEPTVRGPYCGSMGYIAFNGEMDFSITIRTFAMANRHLTFQVGGAITVDSNPAEEYQETLVKAAALQRTLTIRD